MKREAFFKRREICVGLAAAALASSLLVPRIANAFTDDRPDTVTLVTHANAAAKAYRNGDFATAEKEFKWCIGDRPMGYEYYEGLYNSAMHTGEWENVAMALDKMFQIDPSSKVGLSYQYGQALFHLNRYSEAVPVLKAALRNVNIEVPDYIPKIKEMPAGNGVVVPALPSADEITRKAHEAAVEKAKKEADIDPTKFECSYENAVRSECICIAEYKDYEKSSEISWNIPPSAHYRITDILKGPPLNKDIPVKFEFHNYVDKTKPKDWKFDPKTMMPAKDSKWILFIEFAVPKRGMFETYQGSYGRQPATDENVNQLYALLDKFNMRNTHS